jgi:hypothetical protein
MTRLLFATAIVVAFTASANAQRCPAGADAFQSCLPLDHRYGGPGTIQQSRPRMNPCVYNYVMGMRQRGDPRVTRLVAETKKRGGTVEAADTLRGMRDYVSVQRQAVRACRGTI